MSLAENFRNEWWALRKIDHEREKLLNREHKEVFHEMIYQECLEGKKSRQQIADEYNVHKSTVCRIAKEKVRQLYPNQKGG